MTALREDDTDYHRRRSDEERLRAEECADAAIAATHRRLADLHSARAMQADDATAIAA